MRISWLGGCAGIVALMGSAAAPAGAQRIDDAHVRMNAMIVIGETPARSCYEAAAAGGSTRDALAHCDRALAGDLVSSDRAATHVNRGVVRQLRGDLAGAVEDFLDGIEIAPGLPQAHANLGGAYAEMGRWIDAEEALDRAIALAPETSAEAHFMRAAAREELGDAPGAYADYRRAAELAPEWAAPRLELERFRIVSDGGEGGT